MRHIAPVGLALFAVTAGLCWYGSAAAQPAPPASWDQLSPTERQRAREYYQRFQQLPEPDRQSVEQQYRRWQSLPTEQRRRLRQNYERYMNLDPAARQQFDQQYQDWQSQRRQVERPE
jgi:hypothetical protein